ncbi:MAG: hypothetical protein ABI335_22475, partial [Polyangiaceae bacterium]
FFQKLPELLEKTLRPDRRVATAQTKRSCAEERVRQSLRGDLQIRVEAEPEPQLHCQAQSVFALGLGQWSLAKTIHPNHKGSKRRLN